MQLHENPKSKVIAFQDGPLPEHCVSLRPCSARRDVDFEPDFETWI